MVCAFSHRHMFLHAQQHTHTNTRTHIVSVYSQSVNMFRGNINRWLAMPFHGNRHTNKFVYISIGRSSSKYSHEQSDVKCEGLKRHYKAISTVLTTLHRIPPSTVRSKDTPQTKRNREISLKKIVGISIRDLIKL